MSKPEHSPLPCCWSDVNGQDCKCARRQSDQQAIAELVEALETCVEQNEGCFVNHYTFYREEAVTPGYIIKARAIIAKHKTKAGE